jgi:enamine deaminase RidA (YjgF/YER057c/UK114 family)
MRARGVALRAFESAALLVIALSLASGCATTPSTTSVSCRFQNENVESAIGFCQAVRAGDTLYISGVTAAAPMEEAVPRVYERLGRILQANGLTFADVAKETVYATDLDAFIKASGARRRFYESGFPAATWVQVQRLYLPSFVVEVELVAHYRR